MMNAGDTQRQSAEQQTRIMELEQQLETAQHLLQVGVASQAELASERERHGQELCAANEALAKISKQLEQQTSAWRKEKGELETTWKQRRTGYRQQLADCKTEQAE